MAAPAQASAQAAPAQASAPAAAPAPPRTPQVRVGSGPAVIGAEHTPSGEQDPQAPASPSPQQSASLRQRGTGSASHVLASPQKKRDDPPQSLSSSQ